MVHPVVLPRPSQQLLLQSPQQEAAQTWHEAAPPATKPLWLWRRAPPGVLPGGKSRSVCKAGQRRPTSHVAVRGSALISAAGLLQPELGR